MNKAKDNMLIPKKTDFWFLPLGGSGEIGMNLNLYGHDKQWLMVDFGVMFHDRYGIDLIFPDISFIEERKEHLVGLVLTHAHEDHLGAVPYLWQRLRCPIYTTPFTAEVLRKKLEEVPWRNQVIIHENGLDGVQKIGKFKVDFINLTHSIPEMNALAISTPCGTVLHTGDWKLDPEPLVGDSSDAQALIEWGKKGVKALVCDSTNVFSEGSTGSEGEVKERLTDLIKSHKENRVVVACFASNLARVDTIVKAAAECGRKVALVGRSLDKMVDSAQKTGYLKDMPGLIDDRDAMKLPPEEVLFIATGSQGEARAALARIASGAHPMVRLSKGDVVIFSSRVIPGNEKSISALQNQLALKGIIVVTARKEEIHVSGHPSRDDLKKMYEWAQPNTVIPVHGETLHLLEQERLAKSTGIKNVVVPLNGTLIDLSSDNPKIIEMVNAGRWCKDGNQIRPIDSVVIAQRKRMSIDGIVVATVVLNDSGHLARPLILTMNGIGEVGHELDNAGKDIMKQIKSVLAHNDNPKTLKDDLRAAIRRVIKDHFGKKPLAEVHVVEE